MVVSQNWKAQVVYEFLMIAIFSKLKHKMFGTSSYWTFRWGSLPPKRSKTAMLSPCLTMSQQFSLSWTPFRWKYSEYKTHKLAPIDLYSLVKGTTANEDLNWCQWDFILGSVENLQRSWFNLKAEFPHSFKFAILLASKELCKTTNVFQQQMIIYIPDAWVLLQTSQSETSAKSDNTQIWVQKKRDVSDTNSGETELKNAKTWQNPLCLRGHLGFI